MTIVFVVAFASLFAISWADDVTVSVSGINFPKKKDEPSFSVYTVVEYLLVAQYEKRIAQIFDSLKECNSTWAVPLDESIELFENLPVGLLRLTNKPAKCLMDCVMRKNGVMTEEGFQIDDYMLHIKQLRMNYTSYNVDSRSPEEKQEVYDAIKKFGGRNPRNFDLIRVYEWAANKCKNRRDPEGDTCETSWLIARCLINRIREKHFNAPFYPADLAYFNIDS